ncbi:MAG: toxin-antitoxin system YwqK family antitoxin [Verrucomicrobia bacterium]|nr:toxin-antitoxin system YwqK family antitoxin [Verrucomicrobiota bacterium]
MKYILFAAVSTAFLSSCFYSNDSTSQVVSQKYIHKYGFDVSEDEWQERSQEGLVVSMLKNGVKVTRSYEGGQLHGPTTYTFPHSSVVEKTLVYDQGTLLKETQCDAAGMPMREEVYEFDDRTIMTMWDEKGVPISIEEYDNELLVEGKYYTPEHLLEAAVESGYGERIKRDRSGQLLSRDKIENGLIAQRISYHPNGQIHTISHYQDYQLHGEQLKFTASGKPLMKLDWAHGVLHGQKVVYRNGLKVAEIPYSNGQKNGIEFHYDDLGHLTAEIEWKVDKKHGCSKFYTEDTTESEWFFKGQSVTAQKYEMLDNRDRLMAELTND